MGWDKASLIEHKEIRTNNNNNNTTYIIYKVSNAQHNSSSPGTYHPANCCLNFFDVLV